MSRVFWSNGTGADEVSPSPTVETQSLLEALLSDAGSQPRTSQLHGFFPLGCSALVGSAGTGGGVSGLGSGNGGGWSRDESRGCGSDFPVAGPFPADAPGVGHPGGGLG